MLKQRLLTLLLIVFMVLLSGCNSFVNPVLKDGDLSFNKDYQDYLQNHEKLPQSVLDALDLLLDGYISGISTPSIDSIQQETVPSGSDDSQQIINNSTDIISSEQELVKLVYNAAKNVDSIITFETSGTWCNDEIIYDVIFRQVHDTYMIDAYGLHSYCQTVTQNISGSNVYQIQFRYLDNLSKTDIQTKRSEITRTAKDVVLKMNVSGKTEYEIINEINHYLCDNVYYPDKPYMSDDFTPYGVFTSGRAVCDGYARATKILSDLCGLECIYVSGYCKSSSGTSGHAWNLVRIENQYYQLDVTWNDAAQSDDYFLVTDDFMTLSRTWETSHYPASAQIPYSP